MNVRSPETPLFLLKIKISSKHRVFGDEMQEIIESELYMDANGTMVITTKSVTDEEGQYTTSGTVLFC